MAMFLSDMGFPMDLFAANQCSASSQWPTVARREIIFLDGSPENRIGFTMIELLVVIAIL